MTNTLCINMIVKNEAHVIEKTLAMLVEKLPISYWVISDTGSTDGTQDIIRKFFSKLGIDGELVEHEWRDFGWNRTKALEAAFNKSDYLLIFDADDTIHGTLELPMLNTPFDTNADIYQLKFGPECVYYRPLSINNRKHWEFRGVLHEFLTPSRSFKNFTPSKSIIEGDYYIESGRTGSRNKDPKKYDKDAEILEREISVEKDIRMKERYMFYCAQSYKDAKNSEKAIEWYKKVVQAGNSDQEKYYACLMIAKLTKDENEAIDYLNIADFFDPERVEHIVHLMSIYSRRNRHIEVNKLYKRTVSRKILSKGKLFVVDSDYKNMLEWYNSISAYYVGDKDSGYLCCRKILTDGVSPQHVISFTIQNIKFYLQEYAKDTDTTKLQLFWSINDKFDKNNDQHIFTLTDMYTIVKPLLTVYPSKLPTPKLQKPQIMLTMTTCKRYDLFVQTVNSILNQWTDFDRVDYWFCVDDNSSEEDRIEMKKKYPFFDYYFKTSDERGHLESMNIIWNRLNELRPKYWIHIEDDFLFVDKMNYITKAIEGLTILADQNVKQILFNRGYAELFIDYRICGLISSKSQDFCIHDYQPNQKFPYFNHYHWPHYSFRPSLTDTESILSIGNYDCGKGTFFERVYALKWTNMGFKSAFFSKITSIHIGRLTYQKNIPNSYELNGVNQFDGSIKTLETPIY